MLDMLIAQCCQGLGLARLRRYGSVVERHQRPFLGRDVFAGEGVGIRGRRRIGCGVVPGGAGRHAGADDESQGRSAGQAQGGVRPLVSHAVSMPRQRVPSA